MVSERTKAHLVMALCVGFFLALIIGLLIFMVIIFKAWVLVAIAVVVLGVLALFGIEWAMGKLG